MTNRTEDRIADLLREVQQLRTENDELRDRAEPAYVVEYADGRPSTEHKTESAAATEARNSSYAGVEARVRHDGAMVWTVRTRGWGRRADGSPVGPRMHTRF